MKRWYNNFNNSKGAVGYKTCGAFAFLLYCIERMSK